MVGSGSVGVNGGQVMLLAEVRIAILDWVLGIVESVDLGFATK